MLFNYWASILSHWAEKELRALGYAKDEPDLDVVILTELTTGATVWWHVSTSDGRQNYVIPENTTLYRFLKDRNYRIANCVFLLKHREGKDTPILIKVNEYANVIVTSDYLVYEDVRTEELQNLEACSLLHENHNDIDRFLRVPIDVLKKIGELFDLREWFK